MHHDHHDDMEHGHGHSHDAPPWAARRGGPGYGARSAFGPFAGGFGPARGGPFGRGRGRGPGGRARRGDVRAAVLALLAERPMHGYEIIQELAARTGGVWKPSPGSVYPTLQLLEDEGLVTAEQDAGKRQFSLTDAGREAAAERDGRKAPWDEVNEGVGPDAMRLRHALAQLAGAVVQIGQVGTEEQQGEAEALLAETRRRLYAILAAET
ncbi:MAG TPA: PadR family transcriptional regulator [Acidimicrobiales bacterium]|nr:PadR family transcriptional regulator [Acidimicrobiales bacterium]